LIIYIIYFFFFFKKKKSFIIFTNKKYILLDENVLITDNINKNERRSSLVTPKTSKIHYVNLDFINDNYCKYKKPLGIERCKFRIT